MSSAVIGSPLTTTTTCCARAAVAPATHSSIAAAIKLRHVLNWSNIVTPFALLALARFGPALPSPVLLVEERDHAGHAADGRRQPGRGQGGHQLGLAQVAGDFRHDVEQKARGDAAQHDL